MSSWYREYKGEREGIAKHRGQTERQDTFGDEKVVVVVVVDHDSGPHVSYMFLLYPLLSGHVNSPLLTCNMEHVYNLSL